MVEVVCNDNNEPNRHPIEGNNNGRHGHEGTGGGWHQE